MKSCGVFIGLKISAATPRRRALRSGEACLRNGVELFAAAYPKVEKGRRIGIGFYVAVYQKVRQQKILCLLHRGVEFYAATYQKVWNKVFLFFFKTQIWPSHTLMNM